MVVSIYSKTHLSDTFQEPPGTVLQSLCQDEVNEILSFIMEVRIEQSARGQCTQTAVKDRLRS